MDERLSAIKLFTFLLKTRLLTLMHDKTEDLELKVGGPKNQQFHHGGCGPHRAVGHSEGLARYQYWSGKSRFRWWDAYKVYSFRTNGGFRAHVIGIGNFFYLDSIGSKNSLVRNKCMSDALNGPATRLNQTVWYWLIIKNFVNSYQAHQNSIFHVSSLT